MFVMSETEISLMQLENRKPRCWVNSNPQYVPDRTKKPGKNTIFCFFLLFDLVFGRYKRFFLKKTKEFCMNPFEWMKTWTLVGSKRFSTKSSGSTFETVSSVKIKERL